MDARLKAAKAKLEKQFGANVIRFASEITAERSYRISTGSITLDIMTGGGYPVGRFTQVSGAFSSTKSTTVYHGMRNAQKFFASHPEFSHLSVALIQGENGSWTKEYGESIGIDTSKLILSESASMEESLEVILKLIELEIAGFVVVDSLASLVPMKEYASEMENAVQMGLKPKLFDEFFRKWQALNNKLSREGKLTSTIVGINQLREKIGQMHGNPEFNPGGRAIGFTASLDIRLRRGDWITVGTGENKAIIGQQTKFKVHKSKVSIPQVSGSWDVYLDEGGPVPQGHIDNFKEIVLQSVAYGVVQKNGAWYKYKDKFNVNGENALVALMRENLDLYEEVKKVTMTLALAQHEDELAELKESNPELFDYDEGVIMPAEEEAKKEEKKTPAKKSSNKKPAAKKKTENSKKKVGKKK